MSRLSELPAQPRVSVVRPAYPRVLSVGLILAAATCGGRGETMSRPGPEPEAPLQGDAVPMGVDGTGGASGSEAFDGALPESDSGTAGSGQQDGGADASDDGGDAGPAGTPLEPYREPSSGC